MSDATTILRRLVEAIDHYNPREYAAYAVALNDARDFVAALPAATKKRIEMVEEADAATGERRYVPASPGSASPSTTAPAACAYCEKRPATHTPKDGAKNLRPACDVCDPPAPGSSPTTRGAACIGGTEGCPGVSVYAPGGGVWCNVCRARFRPGAARGDETAPPADEPCVCGRTRYEHSGPYGEGTCSRTGCEAFTPSDRGDETAPAGPAGRCPCSYRATLDGPCIHEARAPAGPASTPGDGTNSSNERKG